MYTLSSCFELCISQWYLLSPLICNHKKLPAKKELIFLSNTLFTYLFPFKFFSSTLTFVKGDTHVTWSCYWKVMLGEDL